MLVHRRNSSESPKFRYSRQSLRVTLRFAINTDDQRLVPLTALLERLRKYALTHLAFHLCDLTELPPDCPFSPTLQSVDISQNQKLDLEDWLVELVQLPHLEFCAAVQLHSTQAARLSEGVFSSPGAAACCHSLHESIDQPGDQLQLVKAAGIYPLWLKAALRPA